MHFLQSTYKPANASTMSTLPRLTQYIHQNQIIPLILAGYLLLVSTNMIAANSTPAISDPDLIRQPSRCGSSLYWSVEVELN